MNRNSIPTSRTAALVLAIASVGLISKAATASVLTWDAGGASPAAPVDGSGTWDAATAEWSDGTADNAWGTSNAATATFGNGGSGAATVTVGGSLTASGGLTFNPGATYTISTPNNSSANTTKVTIGTGITVADNVSAKLLGTATSGALNDLVFTGLNTINVGNNSTLEINARYGKAGTSPGITKTGNGTLILSGTNGGGSSVMTFPYVINAGVLQIKVNSTWGNSSNAVTVNSGGAVELNNTSMNQTGAAVTLNGTGPANGGALRLLSGTTSYGSGTGVLTLGTASTGIGVDTGAIFNLNHVAAGSGGLTKLGGGNLTIGAANTYTGLTTITAGTVTMTAAGSSANSSGFDVQSAGAFDVSAVSGFAVGASQSLSGVGTLKGAIIDNGILAPGESGIGTLTTNAGLTLGGSSNFEIDKSSGNALSNDLFTGITSLTEGGALNVAFLNSASNPLAVGDSFTLFSAASYGGGFSSVSLPSLDPSLTWDTSALGTAGVITVASAAAAPEPASLAVLALGAASLLTRRRK